MKTRTDKYFQEWQDSNESQRQFPTFGKTFKVTKSTKAGKLIHKASRATVGQGGRIQVSLGIVGHNAKYFNQLDGNRDQQGGSWGGLHGEISMSIPVTGIADIDIYEVTREGNEYFEGDRIDNAQVQTVDGEVIRWWTQRGCSGRGTIENLDACVASDHIVAIAVNKAVDLEVN